MTLDKFVSDYYNKLVDYVNNQNKAIELQSVAIENLQKRVGELEDQLKAKSAPQEDYNYYDHQHKNVIGIK